MISLPRQEIPLVDLKRQYEPIREEIMETIGQVLANGSYILGENVEAFENEFAAYCGARHAIGVASGTDALTLCLAALGIRRGDEVITVPNTFVATVNSILYHGGRPVFVDVDRSTGIMDPRLIREKITQKTKAIIPVHLYGHPAPIAPLKEIADSLNLPVIEDACQAHGTEFEGQKVGHAGMCGAFSFYPSKNLGAYGDSGLILTDNNELAQKLRMLRNYGEREKYHHQFIGFNSRLDEIQAAVLRVKLRHLDDWVDGRRKVAQKYTDHLGDLKNLELPVQRPDAKHSYYLYVIRTKKRELLRNWLRKEGILTGIHYPVPIHLEESYRFLNIPPGSFPISEKMADEILSLPMYPELTDGEISFVSDSIRRFSKTNENQFG
jgi:dTDP-4-amino-4,6-dideoxygalactose transaminase